MQAKNLIFYICISLIFSSCGFHNRLTSPEILEEDESLWTLGVAIDPFILNQKNFQDINALYSLQPIIGYRSGTYSGNEIGVSIYGLFTPGLVLDIKHKIFEQDDLIISGDIAGFAGIKRQKGVQYDLLFGNKSLYGTLGLNYDFTGLVTDRPSMVIGFGTEINNMGIQVSFSNSLIKNFGVQNSIKYGQKYISLGVKLDILKSK